jgi:sugar/nucleoside kinase (ribokinase family)
VVDSFTEQVVDALGAGDALLAYSTLAMVVTKNEVIASILGCMAAGVECEHDGNVPVSPEAVRRKIHRVETHTLYRADGE